MLQSCMMGLGFLSLSVCPLGVLAQACTEPTVQQRQNVTAYVGKKYSAGAEGNLVLVRDEKANDACFWKFEFETSQRGQVTVYLSPDRQFLTPQLFDLHLDPLLEERERLETLNKTLISNDPPLIGSKSAPVTVVEFSDFECP
jgi:hypothetical protein